MSIHDLAGVEAAAEMGLTRAVLARELSFEQIKFITKHSPIETEIFVHGALCFCHSGQCYMSSLIGRRSGNRGMCAQPCRMEYTMGGRLEDSHPLSLKDNCLSTVCARSRMPALPRENRGQNEAPGIYGHSHRHIFKDHKRAPRADCGRAAGTLPTHFRARALRRAILTVIRPICSA